MTGVGVDECHVVEADNGMIGPNLTKMSLQRIVPGCQFVIRGAHWSPDARLHRLGRRHGHERRGAFGESTGMCHDGELQVVT